MWYDLDFGADVLVEAEIIKLVHICCEEAEEHDGK